MYLRDKLPAQVEAPPQTNPLNDVQKLLIKGRTRIEQGWIQHDFIRVTGHLWWKKTRYCAVAAVGWHPEEGAGPLGRSAVRMLHSAAEYLGAVNAISFNDTRGRTKQDVLHLYNLAIVRATSGG